MKLCEWHAHTFSDQDSFTDTPRWATGIHNYYHYMMNYIHIFCYSTFF